MEKRLLKKIIVRTSFTCTPMSTPTLKRNINHHIVILSCSHPLQTNRDNQMPSVFVRYSSNCHVLISELCDLWFMYWLCSPCQLYRTMVLRLCSWNVMSKLQMNYFICLKDQMSKKKLCMHTMVLRAGWDICACAHAIFFSEYGAALIRAPGP